MNDTESSKRHLIRYHGNMKFSPIQKERIPFIKNTLVRLINQDAHTKNLTVAIMALRDLEKNNENSLESALLRLSVDLDKIRMTNPELSNFIYEYPFTTTRKLLPYDACLAILEQRKDAQWKIEILGEEWYDGDIWHVIIKGPMHSLEAVAKVTWPLTMLDAIQIAVDNLHETANGCSALFCYHKEKKLRATSKLSLP